MATPLCFLNGSIIPLAGAKIGVLDLGVLRGFGIYEGITSFGPDPFHFEDHWARFERSAKPLSLTIPFSKEEVREAMRTLIRENGGGKRTSIRMVLTGGEAHEGIEHISGRETLYITADPMTPLPHELYEKGAHLITHEHQRFMPEVKTIGYITAVTLQPQRKAAGALEILYVHDGKMLECATSNAFIVQGGVVITPEKNVLPGITRKVVLELAREAYPIEMREVTLDEMFSADEVFIASSFKDIVPIVSVDERTVGGGKPGPITLDLLRRFGEHTRGH